MGGRGYYAGGLAASELFAQGGERFFRCHRRGRRRVARLGVELLVQCIEIFIRSQGCFRKGSWSSSSRLSSRSSSSVQSSSSQKITWSCGAPKCSARMPTTVLSNCSSSMWARVNSVIPCALIWSSRPGRYQHFLACFLQYRSVSSPVRRKLDRSTSHHLTCSIIRIDRRGSRFRKYLGQDCC